MQAKLLPNNAIGVEVCLLADVLFCPQVQVKLLLSSDLVQLSLPPSTQFYETQVEKLDQLLLNSTVYVGGEC